MGRGCLRGWRRIEASLVFASVDAGGLAGRGEDVEDEGVFEGGRAVWCVWGDDKDLACGEGCGFGGGVVAWTDVELDLA